MRDRRVSLDRLERHMWDAIDRVDRRLEALTRDKQDRKLFLKLAAKRLMLVRNLEYERTMLRFHIRNIETPPVRRSKPRKFAR